MKQATIEQFVKMTDVWCYLTKLQAAYVAAMNFDDGMKGFGSIRITDGKFYCGGNYDDFEEVEIVEIDYEKSNLVFKSKEAEGWCVIDNLIVYRKESETNGVLWGASEQCEASLALAKLTVKLREANGSDWQPNWGLENLNAKYVFGKLTLSCNCSTGILAFKNSEVGKEFIKENRDLIEKAKALL